MTEYTFKNVRNRRTVKIATGRTGLRCDGIGYSGRCDYSIHADVLVIHTLDAQPPGERLGAALLLATTIEAAIHAVTEIETTQTATTALNFYLRSGLRPVNAARGAQDVYRLDVKCERDAFAMRILGRYYAAIWRASASAIKSRVLAEIEGHWDLDGIR